MRYMEDEIRIKTNLCSPAINGFWPVHYFGVFDGHGGAHFSSTCKKRMHQLLKEQLTGVSMQPYPMWPGYSMMTVPAPGMITDESVIQETWKMVMSRCFARAETVAHNTCPCGSLGFHCQHNQRSVTFSGTTAVTVVLTDRHIITANCGDSRAVLYRGGRVVPLSFDHKGDRRDERARVESSGGRIVRTDTHRVEGILAMTRAIGDRFLKPLVISEPEVTFTRRDKEDEFIILGSDGLWDTVSTRMAGHVTRECLREDDDDGLGIGPPPGSASAAGLLCRLAVARRSCDNISVIVVDLKRVSSGYPSDDDTEVTIGS
ncbi:probable protein phosphatase 2c 75 [Phtheirospermum japonicum]|uniref:protein-serine/threonine phosphatase n=1 Tax=Phtheirospermum japonicum TaxID=374723 RepID=A0A830BAV7_9LAMI|nr:probable protein phosphatase 2c 75 [Phtheirospermum japonicum]